MNIQNIFGSKIYNEGTQIGKDVASGMKDSYANKIAQMLDGAQDHKEATKMLFDGVKNGDFDVINSVIFKSADCSVQTMFKKFGQGYSDNLKKVCDLGLSITPKFIKTVEKEQDLYIVTQVPGTKKGQLIPFNQAKHLVSQEDLKQAYSDLQQITKFGIVDQDLLNGQAWFVTPDDHKIMLPSWDKVRPVQNGESAQILERYREILFS